MGGKLGIILVLKKKNILFWHFFINIFNEMYNQCLDYLMVK